MTVKLAIYDMDKTITVKATWTGFVIGAARRQSPWRLVFLPLIGFATVAYGAKLIDRGRLKQITQHLLLGHTMSAEATAAAADRFAGRVRLLPGAEAQIRADRAAGYRLVMATASYRFYVTAIAKRLGFDAVIATLSRDGGDGAVRAGIFGENCYGPNKLAMIQDWMAEQRIAREDAVIRFYSDHVSDAPTLDWADEAFAVNPHAPLRALALVKGWTIMDWPG
ncbi:HAD-IB family phosphatase [Sphingomonas aliaeris]|uniref:HAD-IB family phosphatase n=1 Tax=Sphingomonas aliaeris TaxID=2759526 RepID=A0A974NVP8_9SPHN|nr:HAD-IB family phosphatase [Sphingomonas aliaeris]QQV77790.1 HAD-IB family phosphatase [Sphingomonas aliaeris]